LASAASELAGYSLLQSAGLAEKVYTLHPLTRHFVARQAGTTGHWGQEPKAGGASW
jgi:hypothetical protein